MEETFARPICVPGIGKSGNDPEDVGRRGQQQRDDIGVSQGSDDGWEEVGHRSGGHVAEQEDELVTVRKPAPGEGCAVQTYQDPRLGILERQLETVPHGLLLTIGPVVLANILFESPGGESGLFLGQPARGTREVGENEEGGRGHSDGNDSFNQEQPTPRPQASSAVHVSGNASRDEAGECTREQGARVKEGRPDTQLLSRIPAAEVVEAAGLFVMLTGLPRHAWGG